jgi:hypothetical protein
MYERGKLTPDLTADDEAGVCAIYPPASDDLVCSEVISAEGAGCYGAKDVCPKEADSGCGCELPRASGSWSVWTLALLPLAASRRRFGRLARRFNRRQSTKMSV